MLMDEHNASFFHLPPDILFLFSRYPGTLAGSRPVIASEEKKNRGIYNEVLGNLLLFEGGDLIVKLSVINNRST